MDVQNAVIKPDVALFRVVGKFVLIATPSVAQVKNEDTPTRPKVAVVLAGGGAKVLPTLVSSRR